MGFYSTMNEFSFTSDYSAEEINEKFVAFCNAIDNNKELADLCDCAGLGKGRCYPLMPDRVKFDFFDKDKHGYIICINPGDYYAKHYSSRGLAVFVSLVIKESFSTEIKFDGEDGEGWGWEVRYHSLQLIEKHWINVGDLHEFSKTDLIKMLI